MDKTTFDKYLDALEGTNMYNVDRENKLIYHRVGNNIEVYDYNMIKLCNIDGTKDLESAKLIYKDQLKNSKVYLVNLTRDLLVTLNEILDTLDTEDTNTLLYWYFDKWAMIFSIGLDDLIGGFFDLKNELKEDLK